jgi:hypothetical protein
MKANNTADGKWYYLECAGRIAQEVVDTGKSDGWMGEAGDIERLQIALARFHIYYTDDIHGTWEYRAPKASALTAVAVEAEYNAIIEELEDYDPTLSDEEDNTVVTDNLLEYLATKHTERAKK